MGPTPLELLEFMLRLLGRPDLLGQIFIADGHAQALLHVAGFPPESWLVADDRLQPWFRGIRGMGMMNYTIGRRNRIAMATVKTVLSLPEPLLADAAKLAQELGTSRSQVFVIALEDFLRRRRNRQILERLDEVYSDPADPAEKAVMRGWGSRHRDLVRRER